MSASAEPNIGGDGPWLISSAKLERSKVKLQIVIPEGPFHVLSSASGNKLQSILAQRFAPSKFALWLKTGLALVISWQHSRVLSQC